MKARHNRRSQASRARARARWNKLFTHSTLHFAFYPTLGSESASVGSFQATVSKRPFSAYRMMATTLDMTKKGAWRYFRLVQHDDNTHTTHCRLCATKYKGRQTSNLWLHLQTKHPLAMLPDDLEKHPLPAQSKKRQRKPQPQKPRTKSRWRLLCALTKMLVAGRLPISLVEDRVFRQFHTAMSLLPLHVSRAWVMKNVVLRGYDAMKRTMGNILRHQPGVGLSSDLWMSRNQHGFLCITAFYIDDTFRLRSMCIQCPEVLGWHTSVNVSSFVSNAADALGIHGLVQGVVTDSATDVTQDTRAPLCSFRCMSHTLQLTMDVLESPSKMRWHPVAVNSFVYTLEKLLLEGEDVDTAVKQLRRPVRSSEPVGHTPTPDPRWRSSGPTEPFYLHQPSRGDAEQRAHAGHLDAFCELVERVKRVVVLVTQSTLKSKYLREAQQEYLMSGSQRAYSMAMIAAAAVCGRKEEGGHDGGEDSCSDSDDEPAQQRESASTLLRQLDTPLLSPLELVEPTGMNTLSKALMLVRYIRLHRCVAAAFVRDEGTTEEERALLLDDSEVEALKGAVSALLTVLRASAVFQREDQPTLGHVLPWLRIVRGFLRPGAADVVMVREVKAALLEDVEARFGAMRLQVTLRSGPAAGRPWLDCMLQVCTLLTPTWKDNCAGIEHPDQAKALLESMAVDLCLKSEPGCPCCGDKGVAPRPAKRQAVGRSDDDDLGLDLYDSLMRERDPATAAQAQAQAAALSTDHIKKEVRRYFALEVERGVAFHEWWAAHHTDVPHLAFLARRHLCVPAASAASERASSGPGKLLSDLSQCKTRDNAEQLACMFFNLTHSHPTLAATLDTLSPPRSGSALGGAAGAGAGSGSGAGRAGGASQLFFA